MACPRACGPMGQRRSCNDKQHFCSASLGQAFDMLLSSLLCPFTNKETEAPKANQLWRRVMQKLRGGGRACLLASSPLASAGSLGPPQGVCPQTPGFSPLPLCFPPVFVPLGLLRALLPSTGSALPTPTEGQTAAPGHGQRGSPLLSPFSACPPPLHPSCISSPAQSPHGGRERRKAWGG